MKLVALTPEETLLEIEGLSRVRVPLADGGSLGVHPGHHPLLAETCSGQVEYGGEEYTDALPLRSGILRVEEDRVTIYTSGRAAEPERPRPDTPDTLEQALNDLGGELDVEA